MQSVQFNHIDQMIIQQIVMVNIRKDIDYTVNQIKEFLSDRFPNVLFQVIVEDKGSNRSLHIKSDARLDNVVFHHNRPNDDRSVEEKAAELEVTVDYYMMEFQ
jgi:hypothetical protein